MINYTNENNRAKFIKIRLFQTNSQFGYILLKNGANIREKKIVSILNSSSVEVYIYCLRLTSQIVLCCYLIIKFN